MIGSSAPTVATLSGEAAAMADDLAVIADVRAGVTAMRARAGRYLPAYEAERGEEWRRRVNAAPWRPEFADALASLAAKPFSRPINLGHDAPAPVLKFADDVDARGSNLHVFTRSFFQSALADGMGLLLIDAPRDAGRTVAEQKANGFRPYWTTYPASNIVALRTAMIGGRREIVHLRLRESVVEADGFGETAIEQIRVLTPGAWTTWRKNAREEWEPFESGTTFTSPGGGVPAVAMFTGERIGDLQTKPPLIDLAHMQVELWRALSRQDEILTYSGSPMLSARGVSAPDGGGVLQVGPKQVLFAGENGEWRYVQPDAAVIREIREQIGSVQDDMQRLGLQPLLARPHVTALSASLSNAKASCQLEAWALALRDALQTALGMTTPLFFPDDQKAVAGWAPFVDIHSDFSSETTRMEESRLIIDAAKAGLLPTPVAAHELQRRRVLGPAFDAEGAAEALQQ